MFSNVIRVKAKERRVFGMITRIEVITVLCELLQESEELKRIQDEHNARLNRLLNDIREEVSQE